MNEMIRKRIVGNITVWYRKIRKYFKLRPVKTSLNRNGLKFYEIDFFVKQTKAIPIWGYISIFPGTSRTS